jgi:hypothetical protein
MPRYDLADMDEDALRTLVEKLEEERDEALDARDEAEADLADQEAIRAAAVAYLSHVRDQPTFVLDGAVEAWRMYEAQLRADLVEALFASTSDNADRAQAGLLLMRRAS